MTETNSLELLVVYLVPNVQTPPAALGRENAGGARVSREASKRGGLRTSADTLVYPASLLHMLHGI